MDTGHRAAPDGDEFVLAFPQADYRDALFGIHDCSSLSVSFPIEPHILPDLVSVEMLQSLQQVHFRKCGPPCVVEPRIAFLFLGNAVGHEQNMARATKMLDMFAVLCPKVGIGICHRARDELVGLIGQYEQLAEIDDPALIGAKFLIPITVGCPIALEVRTNRWARLVVYGASLGTDMLTGVVAWLLHLDYGVNGAACRASVAASWFHELPFSL
jgi:hypothetical protein